MDGKVGKDFEVVKVDSKLGIVFGWGMVSKIRDEDYFDTDNQKASCHEMLKSTTAFMKGSRINNSEHTPKDEGVVIHSFPLTPDIAKAMGITSDIFGWMVVSSQSPRRSPNSNPGSIRGSR